MTSQAHAHINIAATESDDDSAQVSLARQINLFTNKLEPLRIVAPEIPSSQDGEEIELDDGIHVVQSENLSRVVVSGFGSFLSKKSERMVVKRPDE